MNLTFRETSVNFLTGGYFISIIFKDNDSVLSVVYFGGRESRKDTMSVVNKGLR